MTRYSATSECWCEIEWDYNVSPARRGYLNEPPEDATVDDLRGWLIGPKGERMELPDWAVELFRDDASLLIAADEAAEDEYWNRGEWLREARLG